MPTEQQAIAAVPKQLLIGGQWRDASQGKTFSVEDPATGQPLCEVADGTPEDALAALAAADEAAASWAATAAARTRRDPAPGVPGDDRPAGRARPAS